jgi:hypothetical protein
MLRSIGLKVVKVAALVVCIGIGASACWVHGGAGYDGRRGDNREHHEERHEERR